MPDLRKKGNELWKAVRNACFVCAMMIVFGISGGCRQVQEDVLYFQEDLFLEETASGEEKETDGPDKEALFVVHNCGAGMVPGVYELEAGSRVIDAVQAAGGFTRDAAEDARNLAEPVLDGNMIRIPTIEEQQKKTASEQEDTRININTADAGKLQTLPGIGESRAAAIIEYRETYGAFSCIEDIMKVAGIKQAAFEKLKEQITV